MREDRRVNDAIQTMRGTYRASVVWPALTTSREALVGLISALASEHWLCPRYQGGIGHFGASTHGAVQKHNCGEVHAPCSSICTCSRLKTRGD